MSSSRTSQAELAVPARDAAKAGLAAGRMAAENVLLASRSTLGTWQEINDVIQTAAAAMARRALGFVEITSTHTFEHAEDLLGIQSPQDVVRLQFEFALRQVSLAEEQVKTIGEIVRTASRISSVRLAVGEDQPRSPGSSGPK